MTRKVRLHPDAERELRAVFLWYFDRNLIVAESFKAEAEHAIKSIVENPNRWPKLSEAERRYVFPRFPFTIVYRVSSRFVDIIAVAHQKRKPGYREQR